MKAKDTKEAKCATEETNKEQVENIHITVEVNEKVKTDLDLESLFFVGIHKDGLKGNIAEMCAGVSGIFDIDHTAAVVTQINKLYKEYPRFEAVNLMTKLF